MAIESISLNGSWQIKDFLGEDWVWRDAEKPDTQDVRWWRDASVPGTIQNDLLALKEIPDPRHGRNSLLSEWIAQRTWVYRKSFTVPLRFKGQRLTLCFKGVDFKAAFYLNGVLLGRHESQFLPAQFDVTDTVVFEQDNLLSVVLEKAPDEPPQVSKTRYVRYHKTRMNYWWDFCPRMIHLGIWDDVSFKAHGPARIVDVHVQTALDRTLEKAELTVTLAFEGDADRAEIAVYDADGLVCRCEGSGKVFHFTIDKPRLWDVDTPGRQPLYRAAAAIYINGELSDKSETVFGIRDVRFIFNEGTALTYSLSVNGRRVYIKGYNWVPVDAFYGAAAEEKYARLIALLKAANVNLVRVWGGGLIEKDVFYRLCDENGILIWQEFIQSSSGIENKPAVDADFLSHMQSEADGIIKKRRNHPSLAMWCGGNELSFNDIPLTDEEPVLAMLKEMVNRLDPGRHWQATSPQGPLFINSLDNIQKDPGGLHDVHGPWEHQGLKNHCTLYNAGTSLLSSEFGVEGMTNLDTLTAFNDADTLWPPSRDNAVYFHRGAWWNNYALIQESFGHQLKNIEQMVIASQWMQAEGLRYAVEANRRRKHRHGGSLPWQFNEPFPNNYCTCAVDYLTRPKAVYYAVGRAYERLSLTAAFDAQSLLGQTHFNFSIWAANSAEVLKDFQYTYEITGTSGRTYEKQSLKAAAIAQNSAVKLCEASLPLTKISEPLFFLIITGEAGQTSSYLFTQTADFSLLLKDAPKLNISANAACDRLVIENAGSTAAVCVMVCDARPMDARGYLSIPLSDGAFTLMGHSRREIPLAWENDDASIRAVRVMALGFQSIVLTSQKEGKAL